jgi:hypothetical protein
LQKIANLICTRHSIADKSITFLSQRRSKNFGSGYCEEKVWNFNCAKAVAFTKNNFNRAWSTTLGK